MIEMSDTNNTDQLIPGFVGQYRRNPDLKIPPIVEIKEETKLTLAEKKLIDFFKCTVNWNSSQTIGPNGRVVDKTERPKCFASRQIIYCFEIHLNEKHSSVNGFFCFYCYHSLSNKSLVKTYPKYIHLIKHMLKRHRFRRFQCSLCEYRAITEEHVIIHQKVEHLKAITLSDEQKKCKIFVCPKLTEQKRNLFIYWSKYKEKRLNSEGKNETYFQCLYCAHMDEQLPKVILHCVERHPDYPLLYYIPEPQISSSTVPQLVNNLNTYDDIVKAEPRDDIVSSTQKSPETQVVPSSEPIVNSDRRRRLSTEEIEAPLKRVRVNSDDAIVGQKLPDQNSVTEQSIITEEPINSLQPIDEHIICPFCDQTFSETIGAKSHLKTYFKETDNFNDWINSFLLKQRHLCSFESLEESSGSSDPSIAQYNCALCLKLAKIDNKMAKNYDNFGDMEQHFHQHMGWLPVECKLCQNQTSISNCDSLIKKHLIKKHSNCPVLKQYKFQFLFSEDSYVLFGAEQRSHLEDKCISVKTYAFTDHFINKTLMGLKEKREKQLRIINKCDERHPRVTIEPIDQLKWAKAYLQYQEHEQRKEQIFLEDECRLIDLKCAENDEKKKEIKKNTKKSNKTKDGSVQKSTNKDKIIIDRCSDILDDLNGAKKRCETGPSCSGGNADPRLRLASSESKETEASDTDEDEGRISCRHCNDKFKTKQDFRVHSKKKHPNLALLMYAKAQQ